MTPALLLAGAAAVIAAVDLIQKRLVSLIRRFHPHDRLSHEIAAREPFGSSLFPS